jgi:hypothetical protein
MLIADKMLCSRTHWLHLRHRHPVLTHMVENVNRLVLISIHL